MSGKAKTSLTTVVIAFSFVSAASNANNINANNKPVAFFLGDIHESS